MPNDKEAALAVKEHDLSAGAKKVMLYGWTGSGAVRVQVAADGTVATSATLNAAASQTVVSASHSSLKTLSQIAGSDGTVATVSSLANGNALKILPVDSTGAAAVLMSNGGSLSAYQGGLWSVSISGTPTVDTELPAAAALADDTANPTTPSVGAFIQLYDPNDSNWDRARSITAALNAAAADSGIQAVGLTAQFDDVAPTAITENQFGNLRMSANRNIYNTIRDAAGNERGVNVNASNQLSTSVDAQVARVFTADSISAVQETSRLTASLSAVAPQFAVINVAASGDTCIIPATASKQTIVLQYSLVVGTGGDGITFKQGSTAVTGQMRFAANGGISEPYTPIGLFKTASGASLYLNSSLGTQISGHVTYITV